MSSAVLIAHSVSGTRISRPRFQLRHGRFGYPCASRQFGKGQPSPAPLPVQGRGDRADRCTVVLTHSSLHPFDSSI